MKWKRCSSCFGVFAYPNDTIRLRETGHLTTDEQGRKKLILHIPKNVQRVAVRYEKAPKKEEKTQ